LSLAICNRRFLGPTIVVDANGISIALAVLQGSLGDRPTDRPTYHAIPFLTIGGVHSGEAKFCYCLRRQQVFIRVVDLTDRINFSNQQLYSAVRLNCCSICGDWRHNTI